MLISLFIGVESPGGPAGSEGQKGQMTDIQIIILSALSYSAFQRSSDLELSSLTCEQKNIFFNF